MFRAGPLWLTLAVSAVLLAADDTVTFKSDVAMTRIDAQVVDQSGRPITGLVVDDFVLRVDGKVQPIRNFMSESMPLDVLLLLDVSGSMEPHVQRIADASEQALRVLAPEDRVAIMVFDSRTKVRLPFRKDHGEISGELRRLINSESFNGGTRITHALLDAAKYVQKEGRPEARRAIVVLTDDQTQDGEDTVRVQQALDEANAVLSFLKAPYDEGYVSRRGGGRSPGTWGGNGPVGGGGSTWPGGGSTWPGGGGSTWPGGGTRWPGGGSRGPGGVMIGGDASHSAGTATIAQDSGGDVMSVDQSSAFQDTLERLRQRYALHFYWPESSETNPEARLVMVALARSTGARYPNAEVRYRRAYLNKTENRRTGGLTEVSRDADETDPAGKKAQQGSSTVERSRPAYDSGSGTGRRRAVNDSSTSGAAVVVMEDDAAPASASQGESSSKPAPASSPAKAPTGGWPNAGSQPQP